MDVYVTADPTDLWGVAIPAWIGASASLAGALIAVGALVVSILSYRESRSAVRANAITSEVVAGTIKVVEDLDAPVQPRLRADDAEAIQAQRDLARARQERLRELSKQLNLTLRKD
ncbi:hypothetical protein ACH3VR_00165 [Microbacterium sp. B2969]|uniref:Uncharacterized protein n=1 Tax=Microbacterium alkaliflavum TaxID=3248839 RepID=A0ABW7Q314_9MICO